MLVVDNGRILSMTPAEYEEWKWANGENKVTWT